MARHCPATCSYCHLRSFETRCSRERLRTENSAALMPHFFSEIFGRIESNKRDMFGRVEVLSRDPWIVSIDNFLFNQEASALIDNAVEWGRSAVLGDSEDGVESDSRTSTSGWCWSQCQTHPYVKNILRKVSRTASVHHNNFEPIQVLHYGPGEKYNVHHDARPSEETLPSGLRVFSWLLYLNDVEEGGDTHFPGAGVTVKPKKGRAIIWPNVLDADPYTVDNRTIHEAKPVVRGEKYAANVWIRMYDYVEAMRWDCIRPVTDDYDNRDVAWKG